MPEISPIFSDASIPHGLPGGLDPMSIGRSIFGQRELPPPPVVPGYAVIAFLGQGGLGHVWQARRYSDGLMVALKIPHQADPETVERLMLEAETLQSLDHPHIVRLLGLTEEAGGKPVIVMEWIQGPPLTAKLLRDGFPFDEALSIFLPVLDAVAHAHGRGILHRDLKPANILLGDNGAPKVSDFGLARSLKDQRVAFSLTRSGTLAGTVEYLAPERYETGDTSSAAADIFALGIILYEMLTGRPPRGAWAPLSQIKRLDVRLDELMAEAIHPDPRQRLPTATRFRQRLEEIRDSRPRYAGTPLLTRPVRFADALWTIAGLYFLAAGFCSLERIHNTDVPGVFDLTFGHTRLLGGFWTLWVMTMGMGVLWGWQTFRLWRFRNVPLHESLPSPFGSKLGSSRGAAALVALAQFFCLWAPLAYMAWIFAEIWVWASPHSPIWEKVLAITRWGSDTPISPWTWDPAGMFSGDEFWIREMQPGLEPGTWRLHDRQSFFVVTQPLLMSLGAASIGLGMIVTCGAAIGQCWRRHPTLPILFATALGAAGWSLSSTIHQAGVERENSRQKDVRHGQRISVELVRDTAQAVDPIVEAVIRPGPSLPPDSAWACAPSVSLGGGVALNRDHFLRHLEDERARRASAPGGSTENRHVWFDTLATDGTFVRVFTWEIYTASPDSLASGTFCRLLCSGIVTNAIQGELLSTWQSTSTPLYSAENRELTSTAANHWLASFLDALSADGCPGLEKFFLPVLLAIEPSDTRRFAPAPREVTVNALRTSRAAWHSLHLTPAAPPTLHPLPGARWHLTCHLLQSGTRIDRRRQTTRTPLSWNLDLVFTDGQWHILRLLL